MIIGEEIMKMLGIKCVDNGGRRSMIDRRAFQYAAHLPEKRFGEDRRIRSERRTGSDRRNARRSTADRRGFFAV
jgi:hypothetical protein